jgi:hypothetical protein
MILNRIERKGLESMMDLPEQTRIARWALMAK